MRILYVTNYYPPHHLGGYELHCSRVARWMVGRGHQVRILTSDYRSAAAGEESPPEGLSVVRCLSLRYWTDVTAAGYWRREWRDVALFRRQMRAFAPDVVVLWNMSKLASGIVLEAQRRSPVLIYHLMDEWVATFADGNGLPQFWARPARSWWGRCLKPLCRGVYRALYSPDVSDWRPATAVVVSRALAALLEEHGVRFARVLVSPITYDSTLFPGNWDRPSEGGGPVRFLWAGRLCQGKGLQTTLEALDRLWQRRTDGWRLDFCGPIEKEVLEGVFKPRLEQAPWRARVRYLGAVPHAEMPGQYRSHDVFLFTSQVHEGLPGVIIEAFAAALPVIATLTGGTRDVLRPGENCLVYAMGDAGALSQAMERMMDDASLRNRLGTEGARDARAHYSSDVVLPRLEEFYRDLVASRAASRRGARGDD